MSASAIRRILLVAVLSLIFFLLTVAILPQGARAQGEPVPLRVEAAVTGELTAAAPTVIYTFNVVESLRMGFVFDVQGDMPVTLAVLGQDGQTPLAGSTGTNNNGLVVSFPEPGAYFVALGATEGTSATYRLMIDADPPLPTNAFVVQSYMAAGTSTLCAETTPTTFFSPTKDLNVCFVLALIEEPTELIVQWWSPTGAIAAEESTTVDSTYNFASLLSGIAYADQSFEEGWWQAHILLNGELAHIQWVRVAEQ